jgi:methionyl aminopeptidase
VALYTESDFKELAKVGRIAADTLDHISRYVTAGVSTLELDEEIDAYIRSMGAVPATVGYRGYKHASCVSPNEVAVHGVPTAQRILKDGDTVNIDVTPKLHGWHGDTSRTFRVGSRISDEAENLLLAAYEALWVGIDTVRPGNSFADLAAACEDVAQSYGVSVEPAFGGHGIGLVFHDAPHVHHSRRPGPTIYFEPGMVFTIEPVLNAGSAGVEILSDGWTAITKDGRPSAQFEHTVGVTPTGVKIFTLSAEERQGF